MKTRNAKKFIFHFSVEALREPGEQPFALCGTYSAFKTISASTKWAEVTCKKCLKHNPTPAPKEGGE